MTDEELISFLEDLPLRRLHVLARGRVHRHFRMGKPRLIDVFLKLPPQIRSALEEDLHSTTMPIKASPPAAQQPGSKQKSSRVRNAASHHPEKLSVEPSTTVVDLLEGIGVPPSTTFIPDAWQVEAVSQLATTDVIVSAPTGSGKTYVAVEAMKEAMAKDSTVIYTSPLKALSNTKFMEFSHLFGPEQVGILTGDRRDNAQAPLLIMTTEILRNLLYDAASGEIDLRLNTLGLVILDESQFLADPERGVVWEETIIFCPAQARLLLLSASIGNPQELANWLSSIRPVGAQFHFEAPICIPLVSSHHCLIPGILLKGPDIPFIQKRNGCSPNTNWRP
jgi:superfamily II RNA helicase